ncbi:hypothetical protein Tco_0489709 [Tanacetum coccineum]
MEDVGLPRTTGTSKLNSCDGRFGKEKPISDSIDPDRLFESQTVIVTEVTMTEAIGPGNVVLQGDHDKQPSFVRKTREHPKWFVGPPTKYTDYLWVTRLDAEERFNEVEIEHGLKIDSKEPLPLIGPKLSRRIPLEHFFNEDLKILMTGNKDLKERKYAFSVNKHYVAENKCGWIEEDIGKLFMKTLVNYDMDAMLGIHHWKTMRRLAYRGKRSATSPEKVYSDFKITFVDEMIVDDLYDRLNLNDIEDMYVLKAQGKLKQHKGDTKYYLVQSLLVYMRSLIIIKRVKDVQLGVESYQKSLNITKPQMSIPKIEHCPAYTTSLTPFRVVYEDWNETKKFMRGDEVFKFCDGTLTRFRDQLGNMLIMN